MNNKIYNLEQRTLEYAKNICSFVKKVPKSLENYEYSKQLIRSSASVGANYIEANESLGKKDFQMRIKISKKEAKESHYWLQLISCCNHTSLEKEKSKLLQESIELMKIFGSIAQKTL